MSKCKVIFRDEDLNQDIILDCELEGDDFSFKTSFDPPATEKTDLGVLSGQLAHMFICMLKDSEE